MAEWLRRFLGGKSIYEDPAESYMYYRALVIISHKVEKELARISTEQSGGIFSAKALERTRATYEGFIKDAGEKMKNVAKEHPMTARSVSENLARCGILKVEEHALEELSEFQMITPKVYATLRGELKQETRQT
jgi:hypothetical protein